MVEKEELIAGIMRNFNFEKVHKHMVDTNWEWHGSGVPTIEMLRVTARSLLNNLSQYSSTGTGGFEAFKTILPDDKFTYHLVFSVAYSSQSQ